MPLSIANRRRLSPHWSACHENNIILVKNWLRKVRAKDKLVPGIDQIEIYSNYTPLMLACGANNLEIITELINAGANVAVGNDDNMTPAHICAKNGYKKALFLLLKQNSKVLRQKTIKEGLYPLHLATESNRLKMVRFMFESDKSETFDLVNVLGSDSLSYSNEIMELIEQAETRHKNKKFEVEAAKMKATWSL
jgi:ankyrin repeat protein